MSLLREPLAHFLVLGALLFVLWGRVGDRAPETEQGEIIVSAGQIESLVTTFSRTFQRPPTPTEVDGLVEDYLREEVLSREAIALGLDRDDVVIRRRLRQKMEFVADDLAEAAAPTDQELVAYLAAHGDAFRLEPRLTFVQVYFDPARHGDALERDVTGALRALREGTADVPRLGDVSLLERHPTDVSSGDVARAFGDGFARELVTLGPGAWHGPVRSAYGVHLVRVEARVDGRIPALDEIRDAVEREWTSARRREVDEQLYQRLRQRYAITVERPASSGDALAAEIAR
jgi:hypothetical protein